MSYSKWFFASLTVFFTVFGVLALILFRDHLGMQIAATIMLTLGAALIGRFSGTLAERFSRFFGAAVMFEPVLALISTLSRRRMKFPPVIQTAVGKEEMAYENFSYDEVRESLVRGGLSIEHLIIETNGFSRYLAEAKYALYHPGYYRNAPHYLVHKQIQHYLSLSVTPVSEAEIWMDVASSTSPFPEILTRLYGITVYKQDLSYPPGVDGLRIGSDAADIPLPDASIDRISLHCSFEHFESTADTAFIRELARLLKPGGAASIIPLYLANDYQILTNSRYWLSRGLPEEKGACITVSRKYWESHGRFYDYNALVKRVIEPLDIAHLKYRLIEVETPPELNYPAFVILHVTKP